MNPFAKFSMMSELSDTIKGCLQVQNGQVSFLDQGKATGTLTDRLVYNSVFHPDTQIKATSRWLIKAMARASQIFPASISGIFEFSKHQGARNLTLPVFQITAFSYTMARSIFRAARENNACAFIFEIDSNQIFHGNQTSGEFSTIVSAAAIREKYKGPIFIQGDYISFHGEDYQQNPTQEKSRLKNLINEAIKSGLYNLWMDSSEDIPPRGVGGEKNQNSKAPLFAELTDSVRILEPKGIDISLGCQINPFQESGFKKKDIREFMEQYQAKLQSLNPGAKGISKLGFSPERNSLATQPIGAPYEPEPLDPNTLIGLSKFANEEYGLMGRINLKPSDSSQNNLKRFSKIGNAEIHVPLEYHTLMINHHDFPSEFKDELNFNFPNPLEEEKTQSPLSHKPFRVFKEKLWTLPEPLQQDISKDLETQVSSLLKALQIDHTQEMVFRSTSNPLVPLNLSEEMEICKKE